MSDDGSVRNGYLSSGGGGWRASSVTASVVQIFAVDGSVAGAGFLVGEDTVVTCAHVVQAAGEGPAGEVRLAFPHLPDAPRLTGLVVAAQWRAPQEEDIAFLKLDAAPPGAAVVALGSVAGCAGHRVSSFGFPLQAPPGGHFGYGIAGDLLPGGSGAGRLLQLTGANDLTTGFSGGPVVDEVTGLVIGMVTSIASPDTHLKGLGIAYCTPADVLREVHPDLAAHEVCPYRGLEPFTAQHAGWFHGRDAAVESVLAALGRQRRLLLLLGPSGAGKSSLMQAGVLPALAAGAVPGSDRWVTVLSRPGRDLLVELERAGLPGAAGQGIPAAVERRLAAEPDHDRLLLVVDQFEELLTQPAPALGTHAVGKQLSAADQLVALIDSHAAATVVLIMRDDFYAPLNTFAPGLMNAALPGLLNIPATLSVPELKAIIVRPAEAVGLQVEVGLTDRIVDDVVDSGREARQAPVTLLPALELALSQLWAGRRHDDGRLTHEAYERIGKVTGSMTAWCNRALGELPAYQRPVARRILTALVRPADDTNGIPATRQPVTLAHLRALAVDTSLPRPAADAVSDTVVAALTRYRIITTGTAERPGRDSGRPVEPTAELIHDALIRDWSDLHDWVTQDHQFQLWLHRAAEQHKRYTRSRHSGDLLDGTLLAEGTEWAKERPLPEDITETLEVSRRHQQSTIRRTRRINVVLAGILALALVATSIALGQRESAVTARLQAQSRQFAAESTSLAATDPDLASLLAVKAWKTSHTNEALTALYAAPDLSLRKLLNGSGGVDSVAFSPDGKTLATGTTTSSGTSYDVGSIGLWDMATDKLRTTLPEQDGGVLAVAFSPDGKTLATATNVGKGAGTARLWNVATGRSRIVVREPYGSVNSVAFSPDGKTLATGTTTSSGTGAVRLWDVMPGKPGITLPEQDGGVDSVAFSPDGKTLATTTEPGPGGPRTSTARLWDVATGTLHTTLPEQDGAVDSVAFSPDGKTLATATRTLTATATATGYDTGAVRLWDVATGKPGITLPEQDGGVDSVAFSPDGKTLATATDIGDNTSAARLWDVATGNPRITLPEPSGGVLAVAFSPDGKTLATATNDGAARLWDVTTGNPRITLPEHDGGVDSVAFSPDGKTLATATNTDIINDGAGTATVRLWNVATGRSRIVVREPYTKVESLAFSPDGKTLATVTRTLTGTLTDTGAARLWDVATGNPRITLPEHDGGVLAVAFSPDGKTLATVSGYTGTVSLWDVATGNPRITLPEHDRAVLAVAFSPDGKTLATVSGYTGTVSLRDVATGKLRITLPEHDGAVDSMAFSPDGKTLATATEPGPGGLGTGTARLWDVATGRLRITLPEHDGGVLAVAFSPDGKTLATATEPGPGGPRTSTARLWDVATGTLHTTFLASDGEFLSVAFSPDGKTLATGADITSLWDVELPGAHEISLSICKTLHRNATKEEQSVYLSDRDPGQMCPDHSAD